MKLRCVVTLAILAGCSDSVAGPPEAVYVAVHVSHSEIRVDAAATIQVTVANLGRTVVTVNGDGCPAWYTVLAGTIPVAPGAEICASIAVNTELSPGGSLIKTYTWTGRTNPTGVTEPVTLAPGGYTLEGRVRVDGTVLRSTGVGIRIVP